MHPFSSRSMFYVLLPHSALKSNNHKLTIPEEFIILWFSDSLRKQYISLVEFDMKEIFNLSVNTFLIYLFHVISSYPHGVHLNIPWHFFAEPRVWGLLRKALNSKKRPLIKLSLSGFKDESKYTQDMLCGITDADIISLGSRVLNPSNVQTPPTSFALTSLAHLNIDTFDCGPRPPSFGSFLSLLQSCPCLTHLTVSQTRDAIDLNQLAKVNPRLESLCILFSKINTLGDVISPSLTGDLAGFTNPRYIRCSKQNASATSHVHDKYCILKPSPFESLSLKLHPNTTTKNHFRLSYSLVYSLLDSLLNNMHAPETNASWLGLNNLFISDLDNGTGDEMTLKLENLKSKIMANKRNAMFY